MTSDKKLIEQVLNGDVSAFKALVHQHERLVFSIVSKLVVEPQEEIEDLCQDVFLKVHQKLASFKFQSKLSTWIATIAHNLALNHVKRNKSIHTELEAQILENPDGETPESILTASTEAEFIRSQIDLLPPKHKIALTLFHLEELHIDEVSAVMKISEGAVKVLLFRARKQLKERLAFYKAEKNSHENI